MLLAAGCGSRLGNRPKCLLELDGVPLIRRLLFALMDAGVDEIVVVLGHHAELIEPVVMNLPVTLVHNPNPDDGQVSSQRLGLAALTDRPEAVIVALADQPLIRAEDITALEGAFKRRSQSGSVVYPQVAGERGNPVMFTADVRAQILADAASVGCRQWQAANAAAVAPFVTDNRNYKVDIDTPADLERFARDTGQVLLWPAVLATR
ncbi:MAG: nucleotidyltransferase family protein [Rubrivivax sp.]|nr:nucleotidyltransferase family protein [Rubrivivax sp.]